MGFLDNLENNLKALEAREEVSTDAADRRKAERQNALAVQPHAEALKKSPFTEKLLVAARTLGHQKRMLVRFTWLDTTLRLEAGDRKLDLKPTSKGIVAVVTKDGEAQAPKPVKLESDPEKLLQAWLK
ncbi:MAG: hypothetical protein OHK0021_12660 [Bryobacter sp.]|nr:hypothetical protein [Bryobacter sp.]